MLVKSLNNWKYTKSFIRRSANLKTKKKIIISKASALVMLDTGRVTDHQIESIRKNIKRISKRRASIFFRNIC
jgi:ribosomal protein L16/L10AE